MKKIIRERLAELGITSEEYTIDNPDHPGVVDRWGITLDGPHRSCVVEYQTDEYGGRPRYYLRQERGAEGHLTERKTQREAIMDYLKIVYDL